MSNNLESNKIFAAILVAGITAMLGGFIARELVHPHMPETDAVAVEGAAVEGGAASGPAMPEPILSLIAMHWLKTRWEFWNKSPKNFDRP